MYHGWHELLATRPNHYVLLRNASADVQYELPLEQTHVVVVVVVFTLKAVPVSTQYFLTSVLVQLTRTPSVVTG